MPSHIADLFTLELQPSSIIVVCPTQRLWFNCRFDFETINWFGLKSHKKHQVKISKKLLADLQDNNFSNPSNTIEDSKLYMPFFGKLNSMFTHLSDEEKKLAGYIRIGLTTKEIAKCNKTSINMVGDSARWLKKKLGLRNEENLIDFVSRI